MRKLVGSIFNGLSSLKLSTKLWLFFLAAGFVPLLVLLSIQHNTGYQSILNQTIRQSHETMQQLRDNMDTKIESIEEMCFRIMIDEDMLNRLNAEGVLQQGINRRQIASDLRDVSFAVSAVNHIVVVDRNNVLYGDDGLQLNDPQTFMQSELVQAALEHPSRFHWQLLEHSQLKVLNNTPQENVLAVCVTLNDYTFTSDLLGVLYLEMKEDVFWDNLEVSSGYGQYYVLDENRNSIYAAQMNLPDFGLMDVETAPIGDMIATIDEEQKLVVFAGLENRDWTIVRTVKLSDIMFSFNNFKLQLWIYGALILLIMLIATMLIMKDIRPACDAILEQMKAAEKGNMQARVTLQRKDEFGEIGSRFNSMVARIEQLTAHEKEQQRRLILEQIKALQARIIPHFLYNTLDSINWMLLENGEEAISDLVVSLSDLLRYSINNVEKEVTVRDEMASVDNYLVLCSVQYEDKLSVQINVAAELLDLPMPCLILQPIVENAICHGFRNKTGNMELCLSAVRQDHALVFSISDNGEGIAPEKLKQLLRDELPQRNQQAHIGLSNVHSRIRFIYGNDYGVTVESAVGQGTIVNIRLPLAEEKHADTDC